MSRETTTDDSDLPAAALPAWRAYRAMLDTKAAHFAALESSEQDALAGVKPRLALQARIAALLDEHTAAVQRFKAEMVVLGKADPVARDALVALLGRVNEGLAPGPTTPGGH